MLVALILGLHPISASFNPIVTLVEVVLRLVPPVGACVLVVAQLLGGGLGLGLVRRCIPLASR